MENWTSVPVGPPGPAGEPPKLFDGSRQQWDALTDQERRYVLYSMDSAQTDAFTASQDDLKFLSDVHRYLDEVSTWLQSTTNVLQEHGVETEDDLPADVRARLEEESRQLFGF